MLVAIVGERNALDQFHDEEGSAGLGRPGVEDLGDVGVVHQGQGLPLGLEPGQDGLRIHPGLISLRATRRFTGCNLLGEIDASHAPFANLFAELVPAADHAAEGGRWRRLRPKFVGPILALGIIHDG